MASQVTSLASFYFTTQAKEKRRRKNFIVHDLPR